MRPSKDTYLMNIARQVATRSTCPRRSVGCVIVDDNYRIMSTGHNGVPPGVDHCTEIPCPGADAESGTMLDECQATHAEINALMFCPDVMRVHSIYVTVLPCKSCIKAILTSSCKRLVYDVRYSDLHDNGVFNMCASRNLLVLQHLEEI